MHSIIFEICKPDMSFEELHFEINQHIQNNGFTNLDFLKNLGHSIEKDKNKRVYIESGNTARLSSVEMFAFEPHISDGVYGYKKENIYYFKDNNLVEL